MSRRSTLFAVFVALLFVPISVVYADDDRDEAVSDCEVQAVSGGIACVFDDDEKQWELHHPSLWSTEEEYRAGKTEAFPQGPVSVDDAHFYAVGRDLIEVDEATGTVVERVRFPDVITQISASDKVLKVTSGAAKPTGQRQTAPTTIDVIPGEPLSAKRALSLADLTMPSPTALDARWLAAAADDPDQALKLLERVRQMDQTNPFLSQMMGSILQQQGDEAEAMRAFSNAVETPDALWRDLIQLSSVLDESGISGEAEQAIQRGRQQLDALGIDEEDLKNFLPMAASVLGSEDDLSRILAAVQDGDFAEAYRMGMEMVETLPSIEDLSQLWQQVIDENKLAAYEVAEEAAVDLDRQILLFASALLALVLLVLLAGLRIGTTGRFGIGELVVPPILFAVLLAVPYQVNVHLEVAHTVGDLPINELSEGLHSPDAHRHLLALGDEPMVQELVSSILAEQKAVREGEVPTERTPVVRMLADGAYADAERRKWDLLRAGQMPDLRVVADMLDEHPKDWPERRTISLAMVLPVLGILFVLGLLAAVVGRLARPVARPALVAIPGGSRRLVPLSAMILVAVVASICALAGLDGTLQRLALPEIAAVLELQQLEPRRAPGHSWAWITLGVALFAHCVLVVWQWSGTDRGSPTSGE